MLRVGGVCRSGGSRWQGECDSRAAGCALSAARTDYTVEARRSWSFGRLGARRAGVNPIQRARDIEVEVEARATWSGRYVLSLWRPRGQATSVSRSCPERALVELPAQQHTRMTPGASETWRNILPKSVREGSRCRGSVPKTAPDETLSSVMVSGARNEGHTWFRRLRATILLFNVMAGPVRGEVKEPSRHEWLLA